MKYSILFSFFLLSSYLTFSQNTVESRNTMESLNTTTYSDGIWVPAKPVNNFIKGSVYLFPNWIGQYKVIDKNGVTTNLFNLNYNIKGQTLESTISNDSVFQYDIDKIDYVLYSNNKYKVLENDVMKGLYLEIIDNNKVKLYKGYSVTVVSGNLNPLTQEKISDDSYEQNSHYYVYINAKYEKIKPSKKSMLKLLNDKSAEIKEYLSKHTVSFTNDQDLKALLNYYSTL